MSFDSQPPDRPGDDAEAERIQRAARYPLNDYGNGQRLQTYNEDDLIFVPRLGWFIWDGHRWAQDSDNMAVRRRAHGVAAMVKREAYALRPPEIDAAVIAVAEDAEAALAGIPSIGASDDQKAERQRLQQLVDAGKAARSRLEGRRDRHLRHAKSAGNSGPISNMMTEAAPYVSRDVGDLNPDPLLINTERAVIEVHELDAEAAEDAGRRWGMRVRGQRREDMITKSVAVEYDAGAECPVFRRFLEDIQPNPAMRGFLQRWFGYSLTGLTHEQKLVFFHGTGRNGKSTLVDLVAKILDEYATTVPIESITGTEMRKGGDATPDLVRLPGARMVRASEPEEGIRFREATIKSLTGGEPLLVRKMREEFVEVEPVFKLTISGNHRPNVRGTDDGIWRRILLVPFDVQIPRDAVDPVLPHKLWAERAGVLNWLIAGALDFLEGGLREPDGVVDATSEFREDSDPVRTFLADWCEITGDAADFLPSKDLVAGFQAYQQAQGGDPWGKRTVVLRLREKAGTFRVDGNTFTPRKTASGNGYAGIRFKAHARTTVDRDADLPPDVDEFM